MNPPTTDTAHDDDANLAAWDNELDLMKTLPDVPVSTDENLEGSPLVEEEELEPAEGDAMDTTDPIPAEIPIPAPAAATPVTAAPPKHAAVKPIARAAIELSACGANPTPHLPIRRQNPGVPLPGAQAKPLPSAANAIASRAGVIQHPTLLTFNAAVQQVQDRVAVIALRRGGYDSAYEYDDWISALSCHPFALFTIYSQRVLFLKPLLVRDEQLFKEKLSSVPQNLRKPLSDSLRAIHFALSIVAFNTLRVWTEVAEAFLSNGRATPLYDQYAESLSKSIIEAKATGQGALKAFEYRQGTALPKNQPVTPIFSLLTPSHRDDPMPSPDDIKYAEYLQAVLHILRSQAANLSPENLAALKLLYPSIVSRPAPRSYPSFTNPSRPYSANSSWQHASQRKSSGPEKQPRPTPHPQHQSLGAKVANPSERVTARKPSSPRPGRPTVRKGPHQQQSPHRSESSDSDSDSSNETSGNSMSISPQPESREHKSGRGSPPAKGRNPSRSPPPQQRRRQTSSPTRQPAPRLLLQDDLHGPPQKYSSANWISEYAAAQKVENEEERKRFDQWKAAQKRLPPVPKQHSPSRSRSRSPDPRPRQSPEIRRDTSKGGKRKKSSGRARHPDDKA